MRAMLAGSLVMTIRIGHTYHHKMHIVRWHVSFGHNDTSVTCFELDTMVGDAESNREPKSIAEPVRCGADIGVREHGNDGAGGARNDLRA